MISPIAGLFAGIAITIDGAAGTGKGTISAMLVEHYDLAYLDSGLLYRAIGSIAVDKGIRDIEPEALLLQLKLIGDMEIISRTRHPNQLKTEEVAVAAANCATLPTIRNRANQIQRNFVSKNRPIQGVLLDGRDAGTVIIPDAEVKLYFQTDFPIRAERRYKQLLTKNAKPNLETIKQQLKLRDKLDRTRSVAPDKPADDAVIVNTTYQTPEDTLTQVRHLIESRLAFRPRNN